jgi:gluconokinase
MNATGLSPRLIAVIGVSGCGKTTLGKALASALSATFLDADDYHPPENVAKMRAGTPLTDSDRAPWLRTLNAEIKARLARGESVVLACSALKQIYRAAIAEGLPAVDWILLDGSFDLIAARVRQRANHYMPESLLRSQFDTLERPDDAIRMSIALPPTEQVVVALQALGQDAVTAKVETASGA